MLYDFTNLPISEKLDTFALSNLFKNRTTSYKYLFFLSLVDIINSKDSDDSFTIEFKEIVIEMLVNAWYPYHCFNLSFGNQDKIGEQLDSLKLETNELILSITEFDKNYLRQIIDRQDLKDIVTHITRYVPFRLITPFLKKELKGVDVDHGVDRETPSLAKLYFELHKPLYCFNSTEKSECNSIILHPEWVMYFQENYLIVQEWVCSEWLEYMQKCNPDVPAISSKLFPHHKENS